MIMEDKCIIKIDNGKKLDMGNKNNTDMIFDIEQTN